MCFTASELDGRLLMRLRQVEVHMSIGVFALAKVNIRSRQAN